MITGLIRELEGLEENDLEGHEDLSYLLGQRSEVTRIGKETGKFNKQGISHFRLQGAPPGYESHRFVSAQDSKIVAAMQVTKTPSTPYYAPSQQSHYIANIFTDPSARREGHMTRLYDYAKKKFGDLSWSSTSPAGTAFRRSTDLEKSNG